MITPQTLKGFRDFLPEQARKRKDLINRFVAIFEQFGFDPLETPALEYGETLMGKYGTEADKLLYLFEDNGGRKVGMRYDQTVPLSRVMAQYQDLPLPFKRYQIQPVWRAENTQKGRYREFLQCDIDTIGTDSPLADAEIIACMLEIAHGFGLPSPLVSINDRTIFDELQLTKQEIIIIDKLDKIGVQKVREELRILGTIDKFDQLEKSGKTERLTKIFGSLEIAGFVENSDFRFDPFLARGLDYYTSTIFELTVPAYSAGSLAGGGRYDKLIGSFSGRDLPAVGVAFGFDRMVDALSELNLITEEKTVTEILVTIFSEESLPDATTMTTTLRNAGLTTELYLESNAKLEKQLKYADKKGIPYVIIQGPDEKNRNVVKLKIMETKQQEELTVEQVISKLTNDE